MSRILSSSARFVFWLCVLFLIDSMWTQLISSQNKSKVLAAIAVLWAIWRIRRLMNAQHEGKIMSLPLNMFPQYFQSKTNGLWLFHRAWPVNKPKAIVFLVHGYGEHIGRYEHVAAFLNQHGFSVYGMDHQGHGQSFGTPAYVEAFAHYVNDYLQFVGEVQRSFSAPLPCYLIGHSMGGAIAMQVMRASYSDASPVPGVDVALAKGLWKWRGAIFSAPALKANPKDATPVLRAIGRVLSHILPKLGIIRLDSKDMSRIKEVCLQYDRDPLNYRGRLAARWSIEMLHSMDNIMHHLPTIQFPFLCLHGADDQVVMLAGSQQLVEHAGSEDKTIKVYQAAKHECFNDLCKDEVFEDMRNWLDARL